MNGGFVRVNLCYIFLYLMYRVFEASRVCNCKLRCLIDSSFLVLHIDRSTVLVHQPLSPNLSHSESILSPMFTNQSKARKPSKAVDLKYSDRGRRPLTLVDNCQRKSTTT